MQPGFFDQEDRLTKLGDALPRLDSIVDWSTFRPLLKVIHQMQRKSNAGCEPHDVTLMFKMLVLQAPYNLPGDQAEFQVRDRLSFQRFLLLHGLSGWKPAEGGGKRRITEIKRDRRIWRTTINAEKWHYCRIDHADSGVRTN